MSNSVLTIGIPTKNHSEYIDKVLCYYNDNKVKHLIIIIDSSDNEFTEKIVKKYINSGLKIQYKKVDCFMTPDEKSLLLLKLNTSKYIWICGDGLILDAYILNYMIYYYSHDIYHFVNLDAKMHRNYIEKKQYQNNMIYNEPFRFACDFFWTATFMGSILLKSNIALRIVNSNSLSKYMNTGFLIICSLLDVISVERSKIIVNCCHYYYPNPCKRKAIWMQEGKIFQIWAVDMPKAVRNLPTYYDLAKKSIIKNTGNYNNYLNIIGIIRWRSENILNRTIFYKYKENLEETSNVPLKVIELISCLPIYLAKIAMLPIHIRNVIKRNTGGKI